MPVNGCQKGKAAEREVVNILKEMGFKNCKRGLQFQGGGADVADVVGIKGVHFEVKRTETLQFWQAFKQAVTDASVKKELPAVVFRRNRSPWIIAIELNKLIELAEIISTERQENASS
jgi:Holliday junction resolvase